MGRSVKHNTICYTQLYNIYKLTCPDCNKAYIGQTGSPFEVRFHEHFRDFTHTYIKSKSAHLLDHHHHSIGPMDTIMDTLNITTKGTMMNAMEKFHIYIETLKKKKKINDKCTVRPNIIFNTIAQHNPDRGHSTQA
jgi:hypothetical protein